MEHTTRAYISSKSGGFDVRYRALHRDSGALSSNMRYTITEDGTPYYAGGKLVAKGSDADSVLARAAVAEARRILADVERPSIEVQHYDWSEMVRPGYQACRLFSMAPGEREALVDGLAAFVGGEGTC